MKDQLRRANSRVRVHAGGRIGERSPRQLLPLSGTPGVSCPLQLNSEQSFRAVTALRKTKSIEGRRASQMKAIHLTAYGNPAQNLHHESCVKSSVERFRYFVVAYHCLGRAPQPLS